MRKIVLVAACAVLLPGVGSSRLAAQTKPILTTEQVKRVAAAAEAEAARNNWRVVIAIVDDGGHLLHLQRNEQVQLASLEIAQAKARTSVFYRRPTKALADALVEGRQSLLVMPQVMPLEGGVPLLVNGQVVGGIGVSGVTSQQDAQIASAGAAALGT